MYKLTVFCAINKHFPHISIQLFVTAEFFSIREDGLRGLLLKPFEATAPNTTIPSLYMKYES